MIVLAARSERIIPILRVVRQLFAKPLRALTIPSGTQARPQACHQLGMAASCVCEIPSCESTAFLTHLRISSIG